MFCLTTRPQADGPQGLGVSIHPPCVRQCCLTWQPLQLQAPHLAVPHNLFLCILSHTVAWDCAWPHGVPRKQETQLDCAGVPNFTSLSLSVCLSVSPTHTPPHTSWRQRMVKELWLYAFGLPVLSIWELCPPKRYVEVLTLSILGCDLIWKWGLYQSNQAKKRSLGLP